MDGFLESLITIAIFNSPVNIILLTFSNLLINAAYKTLH
jgi:hypothetical protein